MAINSSNFAYVIRGTDPEATRSKQRRTKIGRPSAVHGRSKRSLMLLETPRIGRSASIQNASSDGW